MLSSFADSEVGLRLLFIGTVDGYAKGRITDISS